LSLQRFYPLLRKEESSEVTNHPHLSVKAFGLSGKPKGEMGLSLHAGYSDLIGESVLLGSFDIPSPDLSLLLNKKSLVAAAHLHSPGSGEVVLGILPDDRIIGRLHFTLPGLVC
jgi:hypothetical protein